MSEQVGTDANARTNRDTLFRSLERPKATGFRTAFIADIQPVQVRTTSGLYVGTRLGLNVDLTRLFRVVERTVRGLFFRETGRQIDPKYDVHVFNDDTLLDIPKSDLQECQQTILIPLAQKAPRVVANGAFHYRFEVTNEDPFVSVWGLSFYQRVSFLALTGTRIKTG